MIDFDPHETAGAALALGFLLLAVVLYRRPEIGVDAATVDLQSALFFLGLPLLGLTVGVYSYVDGRYSAGPVFLLGTYLGIVGLGVSLRYLVTGAPLDSFFGVGVLILGLAIVALTSSVLQVTRSLGFGVSNSQQAEDNRGA